MDPLTRQQAIAALTAPGQPHALEDIVVGGRRLRNFVHAPPSLRALYESTASDKPFLVYGDDRLSFAQAWAGASRLGHALVQRCGIAPGDRVAIAMRNYPEWVLAFSAITSIGAIAVAINAMWQSDELAYALADCGAKVVFADAERIERLRHAAPLPGLHQHLARFEVPRDIVKAPAPLPRTPSGKILKRQIRDMALAAAAGQAPGDATARATRDAAS